MTSQVTKNPNRPEASKKSYQERMLRMKDEILKNAGTNSTNVGTNDEIDKKSEDSNGGCIFNHMDWAIFIEFAKIAAAAAAEKKKRI